MCGCEDDSFVIAQKLAQTARDLDECRRFLNGAHFGAALDIVNSLHAKAEEFAGDRVSEIYGMEEALQEGGEG